MSKDSGLFLESAIDDEGEEILVQTRFSGKDSQKWELLPCGLNPMPNPHYPYRSAVAAAMKVHELTPQFEWIEFKGTIPPKTSTLIKAKTGNCLGESSFTVALSRYIGIPAAIDFTPNYGNHARGHSWSVLINPDGTSTLFHSGFAPGDSVYFVRNYIRPKIYRHRFSINRQIVSDLKGEEEIPKLFRNPTFTDVTDEYEETTDIIRLMPEGIDANIAYICVFDNKEWVPVDYGVIKDKKVVFKSMGRNVTYITGTYKDGKIIPFGNPFTVGKNGTVRDIRIDDLNRQDMTLLRKYPFMSYNEDFNRRLDGGRFEASDNPTFSNAMALHTHHGLTDGNWYDVEVDKVNSYKYVRYIGKDDSFCNINEIEFLGEDGEPLRGEVIGTKGIDGKTKEKVFDGDILTGFEGISPDGHWVGLKFDKPERISRIRYIARTDGNCIESGDDYELMYWKDNRWYSMGKKKATRNSLQYRDVPSGTLYLLHDLTKGAEERIFTFEEGKQIWW